MTVYLLVQLGYGGTEYVHDVYSSFELAENALVTIQREYPYSDFEIVAKELVS